MDEELPPAAERRATVISDALREAMARSGPTQQVPAFRVTALRTGGYRRGVDVTDGAALRDIMDQR